MARLRIPPGFFNAHYRWAFAGSSHSMSFAIAGGLDDAVEPNLLATELSTAFTTGYGMSNVYSNWTFHGVYVEVGNDGPDLSGEFDPAAPGTAGSGAFPPMNTSLIWKKKTSFAGRKYRGRIYVPTISLVEGDVDSVGNIDTTVQGVVAGNFNDFLSQIATEVPELNGLFLLHEGATAPTQVVDWILESMVATQRRRLR